MVIWIYGLAGSGKSTINKKLCIYLKQKNYKVISLDGDDLRLIWGDDLGHDIKSRFKNAGRTSKLTKYLFDQKFFVVVSILSLFPEWLDWNRKNIVDYNEVFLDAPLHILKKRKDIYDNKKNVAGIDIPYDFKKNFEVKISPPDIFESADYITDLIIKKLVI